MLTGTILQAKGTQVFSISPSATLDDVVRLLVERNCGSLVVCDEHDGLRMVGIITERDILRTCAAKRGALAEIHVADVMTRDVLTGTPQDDVAQVMGLMTTNRVRHLPILEDGRLIGLISIGDVVKAQHRELTAENHYLMSYIQG